MKPKLSQKKKLLYRNLWWNRAHFSANCCKVLHEFNSRSRVNFSFLVYIWANCYCFSMQGRRNGGPWRWADFVSHLKKLFSSNNLWFLFDPTRILTFRRHWYVNYSPDWEECVKIRVRLYCSFFEENCHLSRQPSSPFF